MPVFGVCCSELESILNNDEKTILDIRDYNASYKSSVEGAVNIPLSYLNRYAEELSSKEVHLIASNNLEKNVGIRFLRKKGFHVTSYSVVDSHHKNSFQSKRHIKTCC
jgi:rhodanese-related sulfurtransferase